LSSAGEAAVAKDNSQLPKGPDFFKTRLGMVAIALLVVAFFFDWTHKHDAMALLDKDKMGIARYMPLFSALFAAYVLFAGYAKKALPHPAFGLLPLMYTLLSYWNLHSRISDKLDGTKYDTFAHIWDSVSPAWWEKSMSFGSVAAGILGLAVMLILIVERNGGSPPTEVKGKQIPKFAQKLMRLAAGR